jgi:hypothetical protein
MIIHPVCIYTHICTPMQRSLIVDCTRTLFSDQNTVSVSYVDPSSP